MADRPQVFADLLLDPSYLDASLRARVAEIETLLETVPLAVLIAHDPACTRITGNRAAVELLRAPLGSNVSKTAPPEEIATQHVVRRDGRELGLDELPMQYAAAHDAPVRDAALEIVFADGVVKYLAGYAAPLHDEQGEVRGAIAIYLDIGESRRILIENAKLQQETQQHVRRARALAEAAQAFAEASLDLQELLDRVTRRTAELIGDVCFVRFLSEDGDTLDLAAVYHTDEQVRERVRALFTDVPQRIDEGFAPALLRAGQTLLVPEVDQGALRASLRPELWPYLDDVGIYSSMVAPLRARGRVFGILTLTRDRPGNPYTADDRVFLTDLADRAALAIDNARLYAAERAARRAAERAAERTVVLQTVTAALSDPHTIDQIADIVLNQGMAAVGATGAALALLHDDGTFEVTRMIGYPPAVRDAWAGRRYEATLAAPIPDAVRSRAPIWLETPEAIAERYPLLAAQLDASQRGAWVSVPLLANERAYGGFTFIFAGPRPFDADDHGFMLAMAQQCAQAIERAGLHQAQERAAASAEQARQRLALLAEVSGELTFSLDYQTTLRQVARAAVPTLADMCIVYVQSADGWIDRLASAHVDPAQEEVLRTLRAGDRVDPYGSTPTARVIRSGKPEVIYDVDLLALMEGAESERQRNAYRALGVRSYIVVPLIARGRVLGAISLTATSSDRRYTADDVALAEEVARRAAQAVDNAQLYHEAQEAIGLRDAFYSVAAHELRTPLTAMLGHAQLLQRILAHEGTSIERLQRTAGVMVGQARRLNSLILALLDISRIEQGRFSIASEPLDLVELTRRVVDEVQPTLPQHAIALSLPDRPVIVRGDALRLEQVLQNLIQNAVKYSPRGDSIDVRVQIDPTGDGRTVTLAVTDRGIGIPQAALPRLFQRFFRAENADERRFSGLGIGLYVVREIVTLHHGQVTVESVEGQGSTFTVELPLDTSGQ